VNLMRRGSAKGIEVGAERVDMSAALRMNRIFAYAWQERRARRYPLTFIVPDDAWHQRLTASLFDTYGCAWLVDIDGMKLPETCPSSMPYEGVSLIQMQGAPAHAAALAQKYEFGPRRGRHHHTPLY